MNVEDYSEEIRLINRIRHLPKITKPINTEGFAPNLGIFQVEHFLDDKKVKTGVEAYFQLENNERIKK
jgi:hypothetical protein